MEHTQKKVGVVDESKGLLVAALDPAVEVVRFKSFPYPWLLRELFTHAPRVHTLLMPRETREHITQVDVYTRILAQHPITLALSLLTGKKRVGFKMSSYKERQAFMETLDAERRALFDELMAFNFIEAEITSRYFCLNGEEYLPPAEVAQMFGCSQGGLQVWVGMILYYLDSPLEVPQQAISYVPGLKKQGASERVRLEHVETQKNMLASHGVENIPAGMPLRCIEAYAVIHRAWQQDELSELTMSASERNVLIERYGLQDGIFKTLDEIGESRDLTRERIRQLEASGLRKLRSLEGGHT